MAYRWHNTTASVIASVRELTLEQEESDVGKGVQGVLQVKEEVVKNCFVDLHSIFFFFYNARANQTHTNPKCLILFDKMLAS